MDSLLTPIAPPDVPDHGPFAADWTIQQVVRWLAGDDERCHDERCHDMLDRLDRALTFPDETRGSRQPRSTVLLVRALVAQLRESPGLGSVRLGEVLGMPPRRESPRRESPQSEPSAGVLRGA